MTHPTFPPISSAQIPLDTHFTSVLLSPQMADTHESASFRSLLESKQSCALAFDAAVFVYAVINSTKLRGKVFWNTSESVADEVARCTADRLACMIHSFEVVSKAKQCRGEVLVALDSNSTVCGKSDSKRLRTCEPTLTFLSILLTDARRAALVARRKESITTNLLALTQKGNARAKIVSVLSIIAHLASTDSHSLTHVLALRPATGE